MTGATGAGAWRGAGGCGILRGSGRLAQLVRAPCLHRGRRGFESLIAHLATAGKFWKFASFTEIFAGFFSPCLDFIVKATTAV